MGRKIDKSLSNKENSTPEPKEKTLPNDFTDETDIIECSILEPENKYNYIRAGKSSDKRPKEKKKKNMGCTDLGNVSISNQKQMNSPVRLSLKKGHRVMEEAESERKSEFSFHTPRPSKNLGGFMESNSGIKKIISTLKGTPDGPYLSKSKIRNIEQWLLHNDVETVSTPPFANLSVTPVHSSKKKPFVLWKNRKKELDDSSMDSEVEDILKAVYGDDWLQEKVQGRCKTEPKKSKLFSLVTCTEKKMGTVSSAKRNILSSKKLNLLDSSEEEIINLDSSVLSGVRVINSDFSSCSHERLKTKPLKNPGKEKKRETETDSVDSFCLSPVVKNMRTKTFSENKKTIPKTLSTEKVAFKTPKKTFLASLSVSTPTSRCHPEAQGFKINFKSKKEELVKKLYKLYNGEIFGGKLAEDMDFSWNVKLRGTAGYCYNKRVTKSTGEVIRLSRIEFSTKIVDRADRLRDTMIHELCHAASWIIDGVLDGHGAVWSQWASRAMNRFPELPLIKRCHNYEIVSKYVYRCTSCGYSIKRHSKSINTERKRCGHCYGVLELLINKKRRGKGEIPQFDTTRTLRTPNKFAIFVKENYHSVKSAKADVKHAEIMKILSQQYALTKSGRKSAKKSEG